MGRGLPSMSFPFRPRCVVILEIQMKAHAILQRIMQSNCPGLSSFVGKREPSIAPRKKRTAPSVPKWSPTSVLTGPDQA